MSSRGYAQFVEIHVDSAAAWAAFTEEPALRQWLALEAQVEPHAGGGFRVRLRDGRVRDATIDVWDVERRLRLIYFPDPELVTNEAYGPIVEDVLFDAKPGRTVVRVLGAGVPAGREHDRYYAKLRLGWAYALHELKKHLEAAPGRAAS